MRIQNIRFLSKANNQGNKKSNSVIITMVVLVISLTLISSFSVTISNGVNLYKNDSSARTFSITAWNHDLDDDTIDEIRSIEHVKSVDILQGMREQSFNILEVSNVNGKNNELQHLINEKDTYIQAWSLIGNRKKDVVVGKPLDESPEFSCIIPNDFYPFDGEWDFSGNIEYINGESLIGETLTIKPWGNSYTAIYTIKEDNYINHDGVTLPALEYKLKIVGVYLDTPTTNGYPNTIFVSDETGRLIEEMAFDACEHNYYSDTESAVGKWLNTPSLRDHYITVDDYNNLDYVMKELEEINVDYTPTPELGINKSVLTISNIFNITSILLTIATFILCIINITQSSMDFLTNRKGEIGLMKAIGYKNRQIFSCLFYEQLELTLKGFLIGGGISAVFIAISNFINTHTTYANRLYIVNWTDYLIFLAISLCITIIVPLLCQIITLHKLTKIQSKDAMSVN